MLTMNIILILLNYLSLSLQKIQSALLCDDRIETIYVYDESYGGYRLIKTVISPEDCYTPDYIDLDVDPGDLIKFKCRNDGGDSLGGGCFVVNGQCKCYDFDLVGRSISHSDEERGFYINFGNGITSYYYSRFLQEKIATVYEYSHRVPLDANEIKCNSKTISAPINIERTLSFSDFIEYPFGLKNLKITVYRNYQIFALNNQQLSSSTKFNILRSLDYSSDKSIKMYIEFINYSVVLSNYKYCGFYIRFCYDSCLECKDIDPNETSHQCLKCKKDYYFIENTNNCMTKKEMENSTYYFDNSTKLFKPCYDSCQKCNDIEPNEISHQCLKCKKEYYFIKNTNNCMTIEEMENSHHYYFDNKTETFKSCFESCKECYFKEPNNNSHQCLICNDGSYFIENTNNCMTIEEMENSKHYYFDNKTETFKSCFESCKECDFKKPNNNSHQCLICKDDFYFIENTNNCMTIEEMENSDYYFDNNNETFKQCLNECSTCVNETYCTNCAENYHFIYNEAGKCISNPKKEDLLYLNKANNTYIKCPEGTEKVENNECIKSSNIVLIIILTISILIIIIVLFFFIKRYASRKNLENEISNTLEKNDSDNQLINIFL